MAPNLPIEAGHLEPPAGMHNYDISEAKKKQLKKTVIYQISEKVICAVNVARLAAGLRGGIEISKKML